MQKKNLLVIRIVFVFTFLILLNIKNSYFLAIALMFLYIISYNKAFYLSRRVLKSVLIFNFGVSLGYFFMAIFKGINPWEYLVYINLKVFVMTYFIFWFFSYISPIQFMGFSKNLSYLTTITISQIFSYQKTFEDFKLAFKSRVYKLKDKNPKFITRTFDFFLTKALNDANERALAMKARGFFED